MEYEFIDVEAKRRLLRDKLRSLEAQHYDASVKLQIAEAVGDDGSVEQFSVLLESAAKGAAVVSDLIAQLGPAPEPLIPAAVVRRIKPADAV